MSSSPATPSLQETGSSTARDSTAEGVRISDLPAHGPGRRYLVERGLEGDGQAAVDALIADHLAQAARDGRIPAEYVPIDVYLEAFS